MILKALVEQIQIVQSRDATNVPKIHTIIQCVVNAFLGFSPIGNSASLANSPAQYAIPTLMDFGFRSPQY